jgi:hypothetical protein
MSPPRPIRSLRLSDEARKAEADRQTKGLAALAFSLFLVLIGLYLVQRLAAQSRIEDCLMSGRTNCAPVDQTGLER